jgi:hypothetical protein
MQKRRGATAVKVWVPGPIVVPQSPVSDGAKRVGIPGPSGRYVWTGPQFVSEVYPPRRFPNAGTHWDLEFLFRGTVPTRELPSTGAWSELRFVDLRTTPKTEIVRSHEDVLASAGLPLVD